MIKQGSAVMRIVAIAVSIAIVIGFSSVMFQVTARAENADDVVSQLGKLGNYGCFKYTAGQHVSFEFLRNIYQTSNSPYVAGAVFGFKDGKFVSISKTDTRILLGARSSSDSSLVMSFCSVNLYEADYPDKYDTMYQYFSVYNSGSMYGTTSFKSKNGVIDSSGFKTLADTYSDYVSQFGTTCYAVYTTSSTKWTDKQFVSFQNEIVTNLTDCDYKDIDTGNEPSAEFVSCKSAPTGYPEGVLWFEDWIKEGMQYPYFTWYIRDNGNHHSYSVKFSYNKSQVELCDQIFNSKFYEETEKVQNDPLAVFKQSGIMLLSARLKTICDKVNLSSRVLSIVWENLSYIDSFTLNSSDMDFTNCENSGNKVYSVCLSDYSDIGRFFIYKADIIDNVTGQVLDTTYFCPLNKFGKGNSGYGSKIYDYGDNGDGMLDDLINNTPSVDPSIKDPFDISGDVIDNNYGGGSLSDLNISDIASSLESSVNSVSVFFRFCWTLFPSAIWSIILLGLSLIIILRVLGR